MEGITAAAIGALSGAVVVLAARSLVAVPTVLLAGTTALVLWRVKQAFEPVCVDSGRTGIGALVKLWQLG